MAAEVRRLGVVRHGGDTGTKLLCRDGGGHASVCLLVGSPEERLSPSEIERVEILVRYASYIERSAKQMASRGAFEGARLDGVDYGRVASLSSEGRSALETLQPDTMGAAQRLRGVRDSDVAALLVHLKTRGSDVSRETSRI